VTAIGWIMVEHSRKFTFRFGEKKVVINKDAHEPEYQLYAKALAFALYHKQYRSLRVEAKVDERFQPDLSASDYDGTMLLWAECGNVSMNKVEKLFKKYRKALFVFVKRPEDLRSFEKNLAKTTKNMRSCPLIDIVIYPEHFAEWWVSEEGDVFIPKEEVMIIRWN
jgi:hypothetical protein